jgi:predicted nucleotidyltransferase
MRSGKKRFINFLKSYFKKNASYLGLKFAFLYGSRSAGTEKDNSDIDIAVIFENIDLTEDELFDKITEISWSLSEKIGIDVDVIVVDTNFSRPMLFYNAIVLGIPILITNYLDYLKLRNEAIYHMEDFKIFGLNWQRMLIEKNLGDLKHA